MAHSKNDRYNVDMIDKPKKKRAHMSPYKRQKFNYNNDDEYVSYRCL